jgi:hypothetical protein
VAPQSLFEETELPPAEVIEGCFRSVLAAHERLELVLELVPPASLRGFGVQLLRARLSAEQLATRLDHWHSALIDANWRSKLDPSVRS